MPVFVKPIICNYTSQHTVGYVLLEPNSCFCLRFPSWNSVLVRTIKQALVKRKMVILAKSNTVEENMSVSFWGCHWNCNLKELPGPPDSQAACRYTGRRQFSSTPECCFSIWWSKNKGSWWVCFSLSRISQAVSKTVFPRHVPLLIPTGLKKNRQNDLLLQTAWVSFKCKMLLPSNLLWCEVCTQWSPMSVLGFAF